MISIELETDFTDELLDVVREETDYKDIQQDIASETERGLRSSSEVPVDTGHMRRNFYMRIVGDNILVRNAVKYAGIVNVRGRSAGYLERALREIWG